MTAELTAPAAPDDARDRAVLEAMQSTGTVVPPRLRGRFTLRYIFALLVVGMLASFACFTVSRLVSTQASAAAQVNVAGRQRMLSQRIALQAGLLVDTTGTSRESVRATMSESVAKMARSQRGLLEGDTSQNLPGHPSSAIAALYRGGTQQAVDSYLATAREVLAASPKALADDDSDVQALQAQALGPLLTSLDTVVQTYQRESETRVATIERQEIAVLVVTLLVLVVEATLVFRPMSRRIEQETERLEQASARHQAEAARHAFSLRLRDAVDLADSEDDLIATVMQAVAAGDVPGRAELLLSDESPALTSVPEPPTSCGCSVGSTEHCPSLRNGRTMVFPDSSQLGACPFLRRDAGQGGTGAVASTCVPVTFLGTSIGVLRTVTAVGHPVGEVAREALETIASTAGTHMGTLRAFARSRSDAERDPMTGLLNRRGLELAVARLEAQRTPFVAIAIDLDHFKAVNDTYGHETGDTVLIDSAHVMASVLRPGDVLARHGGEEFVVIVPLTGEGLLEGHGLTAGVTVAERVRTALSDRAEQTPGPSCTASLGVAGPATGDLESVLRLADAALYRAKAGGRNRVEVAGDMLGAFPASFTEPAASPA